MKSLSIRALALITRPMTGPIATTEELEGAIAIVVLGCPLAVGGAVSAAGIERVETAAELYRSKVSSVVVFTGKGEAAVMAQRGIELGIKADDVVIEERSRTTAENAEQTARVLGVENAPTNPHVILVSQPFHLRRACLLFRRWGFDPVAVCATHSIQWENPSLALRWLLREAAAWLKAGWDNMPRLGRSGPQR